ncbi:MAG: sodium:solute symporter, partial [Ruminococcus sp.]|nr:sodium:solute symporter [Ruminococcus sp.]
AVLNINGGLGGSIDAMKAIEGSDGVYASLFGPDPIKLLGVVILTSLGTWGLPQMVQKFYAIKDDRAVKTGTIVSTVFAVVVAGGCYFLGGFGRLFAENVDGVPKDGFDSIVPLMMEKLPSALFGLVIVLVLSASMSTLSSLVLTSSSTLTIDLIKPFLKGKLSEKKEVSIMRAFIAFFLVVSVLIAIYSLYGEKSSTMIISNLMGISWGALAGAFLAPFMYGLFWKGVTKAAVAASFISGVGITVVHMMVYTFGGRTAVWHGLNIASPVNAGAFAMLFGLVLVPVVSLITKSNEEDKKVAQAAFEGYSLEK